MTTYFERIQNIKLDPIQGGYSDMRLWPFYLGYSGSILFLYPLIGGLLSFLLVSIPAFSIIAFIARYQNKNPEIAVRMAKEIDELYKSIEARDKLANKKLAYTAPIVKQDNNRTEKQISLSANLSTEPF